MSHKNALTYILFNVVTVAVGEAKITVAKLSPGFWGTNQPQTSQILIYDAIDRLALKLLR